MLGERGHTFIASETDSYQIGTYINVSYLCDNDHFILNLGLYLAWKIFLIIMDMEMFVIWTFLCSTFELSLRPKFKLYMTFVSYKLKIIFRYKSTFSALLG